MADPPEHGVPAEVLRIADLCPEAHRAFSKEELDRRIAEYAARVERRLPLPLFGQPGGDTPEPGEDDDEDMDRRVEVGPPEPVDAAGLVGWDALVVVNCAGCDRELLSERHEYVRGVACRADWRELEWKYPPVGRRDRKGRALCKTCSED